jgi:hypothetical protein
VKVAIFIATLIGCVSPHLVAAQTASRCQACVGAAKCDVRHASCTAECTARYFSIDPKRSQCMRECANTSDQCTKIAGIDCRSRNLCR